MAAVGVGEQTSDEMGNRAAIAATRAFFGPRAASWEERFAEDGPRYERAVAELGLSSGGRVLDAACGTGRALPALRAAVGPSGQVVALDLTVEMLDAARRRGREAIAGLVVGDVARLPLASGGLDAVFAAGLVSHLPDPVAGLRELGRVCRPGARLALFHPVGRATLAARHGHDPDPGDIRAPGNIGGALAQAGWLCESIEDGPDRYLVLAVRLAPSLAVEGEGRA